MGKEKQHRDPPPGWQRPQPCHRTRCPRMAPTSPRAQWHGPDAVHVTSTTACHGPRGPSQGKRRGQSRGTALTRHLPPLGGSRQASGDGMGTGASWHSSITWLQDGSWPGQARKGQRAELGAAAHPCSWAGPGTWLGTQPRRGTGQRGQHHRVGASGGSWTYPGIWLPCAGQAGCSPTNTPCFAPKQQRGACCRLGPGVAVGLGVGRASSPRPVALARPCPSLPAWRAS